MSENDKTPEPGTEHDAGPSSIGDDQLPADLVASEDNPLAEGLETGEDVHLREEGKRAEQMPDHRLGRTDRQLMYCLTKYRFDRTRLCDIASRR